MSAILKRPYIETKLALLTEQELQALLTCMNTKTTNYTNCKFGELPQGTCNAVMFELEKGFYKPGILLNTDDVKLLLNFNTKYQQIKIIELDTTNYKYKCVDDYLDINELRRVIDDMLNQGGSGLVLSVNGKVGEVELVADDILATNAQSIQDNLERIDDILDTFVEDNIEGSDTVVVDLNEDDSKYQIRLDNDYKTKIDKALVIPTSAPTDTALVAVGTGRDQEQVYLGTGLDLGNDTSPYNLNVVGIQETRLGNEIKLWSGTQTQYDNITTKDTHTLYIVEEE